MKHPANSCQRPFWLLILIVCIPAYFFLSPPCKAKDYLTINSQPPGATVSSQLDRGIAIAVSSEAPEMVAFTNQEEIARLNFAGEFVNIGRKRRSARRTTSLGSALCVSP
jgi:hypothetical protein